MPAAASRENERVRRIGPGQIAVFVFLLACVVALGLGSTAVLLGGVPLGDFRGVTLVVAAVIACYLYAFLIYRLFLIALPLKEGEIAQGSRDELAVHVHFLFHLVLFNSLTTTHFLPIPLRRLVYLALGARLGANSYSAGAILDPPLTRIGDNSVVGHGAVLFSHAIEGRRLALAAIRVGSNVTIGAAAVIMPGVTIGDGAMVSAGAVVPKGTRIAAGEVWGGVPARLLKPAPADDRAVP
jgi:hypothetical protein